MIDTKGVCYHDRKEDFWGQWIDQMKKKYYGATRYSIVDCFWWSRTETNQTPKQFWLCYSKSKYDTKDSTNNFQKEKNQRTRGVWRLLN